MALDATLKGASANSYVTQAEASTYFGGRLDASAWTAASSAEKDAALMMATMRLESENYRGWKLSFTQRLSWPRFGTTDRDGFLYSQDAIPVVIQQATFEYALVLLREPTRLDDSGLEAFVNVQLGNLNVTPRVLASTRLPALVRQLLAPVLQGGGGMAVHVGRA
jgi:hypothetical protein